MLRSGKVVEQTGNMVRVVFERPAACGQCGACDGKQHCATILIPGNAQPGDTVDVEMPEQKVVKASLLVYGLPLLMLLIGLLLGRPLANALHVTMDVEVFSALCGGALLFAYLLIIHFVDKALRVKPDWQPKIVAVHHEPSEADTQA